MRTFKLVSALALAISSAGLSSTARAEDAGQKPYEAKCASCHGKDGKGDTEMGKKRKVKDLTDAKVQAEVTDADVIKQITDGNPEKKMPAFKEKLSADEIKAVAAYVRTFKSK
jgi:cbb3-type cytochrome c oxidase subunit III